MTAKDGSADEGRQFAIIAGSGFQALTQGADGRIVQTVFGEPNSPVRDLHYGDRVVFLISRHGDSMLVPPHQINYRANLKALAQLGTTDIVAMNTVGVIGKRVMPGEVAVPDQIIDYTYRRDHSIYGDDSTTLVNIEFTAPLHAGLRQELLAAASAAEVVCHDGGVYAVTQGPRLESAAEVDRLEHDGADLVGMTLMPEAALAMELGMRYACISLVVNYAAGRSEKGIHEDVEANTLSARPQSMRILQQLFAGAA